MIEPDTARELREIADLLTEMVGAGRGFALFIHAGDRYHYVSSAHRDDMRSTMREWLARTAAKVNVRDPGETTDVADKRLALEDRCVEIGKVIALSGSLLVLFTFDFGDGGHLAYFTTSPNAREVVEAFVEQRASA